VICVRTESVVLPSGGADVLVQDSACSTGLVVTTREEMARLLYPIQPLSSSEAGAITSSVVGALALAFAVGLVFRFVWNGRG
jgi:hypothetical protein